MFWHIVKFHFAGDADEAARQQCEDDVQKMPAEIDAIRFLRLARSVDEPDVTGLIMGFADQDGFRAYQAHPFHIPIANQIDDACAKVVRLDIVTGDDPEALAALA